MIRSLALFVCFITVMAVPAEACNYVAEPVYTMPSGGVK